MEVTPEYAELGKVFGDNTRIALEYAVQQMFLGTVAQKRGQQWKLAEAAIWLRGSLRVGEIAEEFVRHYCLAAIVEVGCGFAIPSIYLAQRGIPVYPSDAEPDVADINRLFQSGQITVFTALRRLAGVTFSVAYKNFANVATEAHERALYIADRPHGFRREFLDFVVAREVPFIYVPSHQDIRWNKRHNPSYDENKSITRQQVQKDKERLEGSGKFDITVKDLPYRDPLFSAAIIGIPMSMK